MTNLIELRNVDKIYQTGKLVTPALMGISLTIKKGEMVAVMGPSGSGKSTLMNIIGLLDRPSAGELLLDGQSISLSGSDRLLAKLRSSKVGFVFQSFNLLPRLSALANVMLPATYQPISRKKAKAKAETLLRKVGLAKRIYYRPSELSGGEKQRVAIARALMNDPEIVSADEPTGNLDSATGQSIIDLLKALRREGRTVIIITHDQKIADQCQRTLYLLDGKLR